VARNKYAVAIRVLQDSAKMWQSFMGDISYGKDHGKLQAKAQDKIKNLHRAIIVLRSAGKGAKKK